MFLFYHNKEEKTRKFFINREYFGISLCEIRKKDRYGFDDFQMTKYIQPYPISREERKSMDEPEIFWQETVYGKAIVSAWHLQS